MPSSPGKSLRSRRVLFIVAACIVVGAVMNFGVAALLVETTDFLAIAANVATGQLDAAEGDHLWSVSVVRRFGALQLTSEHRIGSSWSPHQATGPPDAVPGTDAREAWASGPADGSAEWLRLEYASPVTPVALEIHETHAPGALARVTFYDTDGRAAVVWENKAAATGTVARVLLVPVDAAPFPTKKVLLDLDSAAVASWNEIDAVALVDADGVRHWAVRASASSWYGGAGTATTLTHPGLARQIRPLDFLQTPLRGATPGQVHQEQRLVRAYGWPALALVREELDAFGAPTSPTPAIPPSQPQMVTFSGPGASLPPPQTTTPPPPPAVPATASRVATRTLWRGAVVNILVYAGLALLCYLALSVPIFVMRQLIRMRDGCCIKCGYQLGYDFRSGCPSCGWRRTSDFPPVT
jgi:hypothetical protein